jgi:4-hydroxy-3-polyprenylbenzoate decarboxylase
MTGDAIQHEIPGLKELNAVDAAGVHPLLLAIGSERYTPYMPVKQPAELLTIANHMLGTGQLSLAKFLLITSDPQNKLNTKNIPEYFQFIFERIDLTRDIHFYTKTTIDTLDYSGESLNSGSKVVFAAYGDKKRNLTSEIPNAMKDIAINDNCKLIAPGIVAFKLNAFTTYTNAHTEIKKLTDSLSGISHKWTLTDGLKNEIPLIIVCDDAEFVSKDFNNFLWVSFTRTNPSHDIYGVDSETQNKHWGCHGPLLIDARIKPHHAPPVEKDPEIEKKINRLFEKGGSLYGIIK